MATATKAPRSKRRKAPAKTGANRRNANRKLLREARAHALATGVPIAGVEPIDAMQEALEKAVSMLRVATEEAGKLKQEERFRSTMVGPVPHEWIRLEADLRNEVVQISGRMIGLDIAGRNAAAAEAIALLMAPVMAGVLEDLGLSPSQKRKAPKVVKAHLEVLEGGSEAA